MKRRVFAALLTLCLLLTLLPAGAPAAGLSGADREAVISLLNNFEWYDAEYNCTDAAAMNGSGWRTSLLEGVVVHPSCVRFSVYPVSFKEDWRSADPRGNWGSHSEISSADANWLLKNIFHCTDQDVDAMRRRLSSSRNAYFQNGVYYAALYGVGDGYDLKNLQVSDYGKLTLVHFDTYVYPDSYLHSRYAVVGKSEIDGKSYWTMYYFGEKRPSDTGFLDVDDGAYYAPHVSWALDNGITNGVSDYSFAPNQACTRAQAVTFLWRMAGCPAPKSTDCPFKDVSAGAYYYPAMLWAVENGVVKGMTADTFAPNAPCTRAQIVTLLYRAAGSPEVSGSGSFSDVPGGSYYEEAVRWAVANGITTGTSATQFSPNDKCTRAQMVTFLHRFLSNAAIDPRPVPTEWLGTFCADTGERIEVTNVTATNVTLTHWVLTASGESMVHNTFTLGFTDPDKTVVKRPYMDSNPELQYIYTLDGDTIILTESFSARVKIFTKQN